MLCPAEKWRGTGGFLKKKNSLNSQNDAIIKSTNHKWQNLENKDKLENQGVDGISKEKNSKGTPLMPSWFFIN